MVERGQVVKPTAGTVATTGYHADSRLVVRLRTKHYGKCTCCHVGLLSGELYAAGKEAGCPLCVHCVEPLAEGEPATTTIRADKL